MAENEKLRPDGRRHHYVPRLLLNRFATERKKDKFQTFVFDKSKGVVFKTAVENAMLEQDFNAIEKDGYRFSMEPGIGKVESDVAPIIDRIVAQESLANLTPADRGILCAFAALQNIRGPSLRNSFLDLAEGLRDRFSDEDCTPEFREQYLQMPSEDIQKISTFQMLREALPEFGAHFAIKDLLLVRTTPDHPFILGDTPISMANDEDYGPYGNIGLAVRGIQIHLPISPLLSLVFWCRSIREKLEASWAFADAEIAKGRAIAIIARPDIRAQILASIAELDRRRTHATQILTAIREFAPLNIPPEQVDRLNSLQVACAQRWLVARTDSFNVARDMIARNPKFMTRRKLKF